MKYIERKRDQEHFRQVIAKINFVTCHVPMLSFPFVIGILKNKMSVDDNIIIIAQYNESNQIKLKHKAQFSRECATKHG